MNDNDTDLDSIVDWADGFGLADLGVSGSALINPEKYLNTAQESFVPITLTANGPFLTSQLSFSLTYSASDPSRVTYEGTGSTADPATFHLPAEGKLRLWTRDGRYSRSATPFHAVSSPQLDIGYFVPSMSGSNGYAMGDWDKLAIASGGNAGDRAITLWAEAVRPTATAGELSIHLTIDPDGDGAIAVAKAMDLVRVTAYTLKDIQVTALYSNQFDGNVANSLPKNAGGPPGNEKPYMLMGARANNLASVRADVVAPSYIHPDLLLAFVDPNDASLFLSGATGIHPTGTNSQVILTSRAVLGTTTAASMYVAAGLDKDHNGRLEYVELDRILTKFESKVVSIATREYAVGVLNDQINPVYGTGLPTADNWLYAFVNDMGLAGATNTPDTVSSNDPRLSHHVGALFTGNAGAVNKAVFSADSDVANYIAKSDEIYDKIIATLTPERVHDLYVLVNASNTAVTPVTVTVATNNLAINFPSNSLLTNNDLFLSIGHAAFTNLAFGFDAEVDGTNLILRGRRVIGQLIDLYDFDYDSGGLPRAAAMVQAGYSGLGTAGHIFKVEVNLNTNGLYPDVQELGTMVFENADQ